MHRNMGESLNTLTLPSSLAMQEVRMEESGIALGAGRVVERATTIVVVSEKDSGGV